MYKTTIDGTQVVIPSKLYPLSNANKMKIFSNENTEEMELPEELKQFIDDYGNFRMGFCYTNSTALENKAKELGFTIEFYSGWLFTHHRFPIHHAWCVLNNKHLIDVSMSKIEDEAFEDAIRVINEMKQNGREPADSRAFIVRHARKYVKGMVRQKSEDIIAGKVPETLLYLGSPDNPMNARKIYNDLMDKFPNHPSYKGTGAGNGYSKTQQYMRESGWK